jgi:hypothetical protein
MRIELVKAITSAVTTQLMKAVGTPSSDVTGEVGAEDQGAQAHCVAEHDQGRHHSRRQVSDQARNA